MLHGFHHRSLSTPALLRARLTGRYVTGKGPLQPLEGREELRDKPRRTHTFPTTRGSNTVRTMRLSRRALLAATTAAAALPTASPASAAERHKQLRTGFE